MPDLDAIRQALAACIAAEERLDDEDDEEAPHADGLARDRLSSLISERVGRPPWVVVIDRTVIARTVEADCLAILGGEGIKLHLLGKPVGAVAIPELSGGE